MLRVSFPTGQLVILLRIHALTPAPCAVLQQPTCPLANTPVARELQVEPFESKCIAYFSVIMLILLFNLFQAALGPAYLIGTLALSPAATVAPATMSAVSPLRTRRLAKLHADPRTTALLLLLHQCPLLFRLLFWLLHRLLAAELLTLLSVATTAT